MNPTRVNSAPLPYRVAAIQFEPTLFGKSANLETLLRLAEEAAAGGARLIVTPEMATTAYCWATRDEIASDVESVPGPTTQRFAEIAAEHDCWIVVGLAEVDPETDIYYNSASGGTVTALNIDTKQTREVPHARGIVNADESLSVVKNGNAADPDGTHPRPATRVAVPQLQRMFPGKSLDDLTRDQQYSVAKEDGLAARALNPTLQSFVFTNLQSGASRETGFQYGDLNHLQFNPVDPNVLLYCHEGTWHELDRTWTIRTDGSQMRLMHKRTMDMEINGHEWWSWNGKTVWFDLQTPRSQDFWIAGVNMETGARTRYHLQRSWWGVHFNSSRDDTLFASDGGDATQVAYATDGMWINLLRVQPGGTVSRERLVNMSRHNYVTGRGGVEPNVHITPDKKWVIFTGQFAEGQRHMYAVEIEKKRR